MISFWDSLHPYFQIYIGLIVIFIIISVLMLVSDRFRVFMKKAVYWLGAALLLASISACILTLFYVGADPHYKMEDAWGWFIPMLAGLVVGVTAMAFTFE